MSEVLEGLVNAVAYPEGWGVGGGGDRGVRTPPSASTH